jgi:cell wall-associated NlpC family hydrolase
MASPGDTPGSVVAGGLSLEEIARGWLGVRFRPQGRSSAGVDCLGLILCVTRDAGFILPDAPAYALRHHDGSRIGAEMLARGLVPVPWEDVRPGDILVAHPGVDQLHFAIRSRVGVIEAELRCARVIERPMRSDDRWHSCWRLLNRKK